MENNINLTDIQVAIIFAVLFLIVYIGYRLDKESVRRFLNQEDDDEKKSPINGWALVCFCIAAAGALTLPWILP